VTTVVMCLYLLLFGLNLIASYLLFRECFDLLGVGRPPEIKAWNRLHSKLLAGVRGRRRRATEGRLLVLRLVDTAISRLDVAEEKELFPSLPSTPGTHGTAAQRLALLNHPFGIRTGHQLLVVRGVLAAAAAGIMLAIPPASSLVGLGLRLMTPLMAFLFPWFQLEQAYNHKMNMMLTELPVLCDALAAHLAAGSGPVIEGLERSAEIITGPLRGEIEQLCRQLSHVATTAEFKGALRRLAHRFNHPAAAAFAQALEHCALRGLNIEETLRGVSRALEMEAARAHRRVTQSRAVLMEIVSLFYSFTILIILGFPIVMLFLESLGEAGF